MASRSTAALRSRDSTATRSRAATDPSTGRSAAGKPSSLTRYMTRSSSATPASPTGTHTTEPGASPAIDGGTSAARSRVARSRVTARPLVRASSAPPASGQPSVYAGSPSGMPQELDTVSRPPVTRTVAVTSAA